jgi:hypothetical protein
MLLGRAAFQLAPHHIPLVPSRCNEPLHPGMAAPREGPGQVRVVAGEGRCRVLAGVCAAPRACARRSLIVSARGVGKQLRAGRSTIER